MQGYQAPGGYPPQQQQGYGQYPPQGGPMPGQQPSFYPPQGAPPPGQYGAPPQQSMPQGQYGAPPQQGYGVPPPPHGQAPPYGAPPPGQYGAPPPQQNYGAPPPSTFQAPPTLGYDLSRMPQIDTTRDCEALRKAMKGFGTDEKALINTLVRIPDAYAMASVRSTYQRLHRRDLIADIESETSSYFCEALVALVRGPLGQDVYLANQSTKGIGTNENLLNDVLLGRSNADLRAIIAEYQRLYRKSLEQDVKDDLSMKTERLFSMVLSCSRADESAPVYPQELERDVHDLYRATEGHGGVIGAGSADQLTVCRILTSRSDGQLRAISQEYNRQYRNPLAKVLSKNFDGHMHDALLRILRVAEDRAMADAQELEYCMRGVGTRDRLLLNRVVRIHWDKQHLQQVKGAYRVHMKKELLERVRGETSGDYKRLLEALLL